MKTSRKGEELEVLLSKHIGMSKSEKTFDISGAASKKFGKEIVLSKLTDFAAFQRVTVVAKAIHLEAVEEVARKSRTSSLRMPLELPGLPYGRVKLGR